MIEKIFYILFFSVMFYLLYKIYIDIKFTKGKWLDIEYKYNENIIDSSDNSIVQYPSFSRFNIFRKNPEMILNKDEEIHMSFSSSEHFILTVYDEFMNIMYEFNKPMFLIFSSSKNSKFYIEPDKKFVIFLRSNITEEYIKHSLIKYYKPPVSTVKNVYKNYPEIVIEENEIFEELEKVSRLITKEMRQKGFHLKEALYSSEYSSFPNTCYAQKFKFNAKKDEVIFLICTNKKKNFFLNNHIVEINSDISSMNWFPTSDSNISQILLNNTEKDNTITIFERLYGVSKNSKCLPFKVLIFS